MCKEQCQASPVPSEISCRLLLAVCVLVALPPAPWHCPLSAFHGQEVDHPAVALLFLHTCPSACCPTCATPLSAARWHLQERPPLQLCAWPPGSAAAHCHQCHALLNLPGKLCCARRAGLCMFGSWHRPCLSVQQPRPGRHAYLPACKAMTLPFCLMMGCSGRVWSVVHTPPWPAAVAAGDRPLRAPLPLCAWRLRHPAALGGAANQGAPIVGRQQRPPWQRRCYQQQRERSSVSCGVGCSGGRGGGLKRWSRHPCRRQQRAGAGLGLHSRGHSGSSSGQHRQRPRAAWRRRKQGALNRRPGQQRGTLPVGAAAQPAEAQAEASRAV